MKYQYVRDAVFAIIGLSMCTMMYIAIDKLNGIETYTSYTESNIEELNKTTEKGLRNVNDSLYSVYDKLGDLEESNTIIEYDGEHHFMDIRWNKADTGSLLKWQRHDTLKNEYCSKNGIRLIRITYKDYKNVETILDTYNL